jgi:hypothetical protein
MQGEIGSMFTGVLNANPGKCTTGYYDESDIAENPIFYHPLEDWTQY